MNQFFLPFLVKKVDDFSAVNKICRKLRIEKQVLRICGHWVETTTMLDHGTIHDAFALHKILICI